jgi:hypothetical protein
MRVLHLHVPTCPIRQLQYAATLYNAAPALASPSDPSLRSFHVETPRRQKQRVRQTMRLCIDKWKLLLRRRLMAWNTHCTLYSIIMRRHATTDKLTRAGKARTKASSSETSSAGPCFSSIFQSSNQTDFMHVSRSKQASGRLKDASVVLRPTVLSYRPGPWLEMPRQRLIGLTAPPRR